MGLAKSGKAKQQIPIIVGMAPHPLSHSQILIGMLIKCSD